MRCVDAALVSLVCAHAYRTKYSNCLKLETLHFQTGSTALQILPHLQLMQEEQIWHKLEYVNSIRSQFTFVPSLTHPPNAVNTLLSEVCSTYK